MTARAALLLVSLGSIGAAACGPRLLIAPAPPAAQALPAHALTRAVIVASIDGLRPDAIAHYRAPTLTRLVETGTASLSARTINPSTTLPSHTSMVTGAQPEVHGVQWNSAIGHNAPIKAATIFSEVRSRGYTTAAFFSKSKFSQFQRPGTLDYSKAPGGWFGRWPAAQTMNDVEAYLTDHAPNLLFVHLPDPDFAGHSSGWMTDAYGKAVLTADAAIARLLVAADRAYGAGQYTLIVTADHGGHGQSHGSDDPRDVTIPWIAWGRGVLAGKLAENSIITVDTAATVLYLLGIDRPSAWTGNAVTGAFAGSGSR